MIAQARVPVGIGGRAQKPNAGPAHIHEGVTRRPGHGDDVHCLRISHGIAVERKNLKLVPGHRNFAVGSGAGVQEMKQDALPAFT